jgi:hypothetical protein
VHLKDLNAENDELLLLIKATRKDLLLECSSNQQVDLITGLPVQLSIDEVCSLAEQNGAPLLSRFKNLLSEFTELEVQLTDADKKLKEIDLELKLLHGIHDKKGELFLGYDRFGRSYWSLPVNIDTDSRKQIAGILVNEPLDKTKWYTLNSVGLMFDFFHGLSPHGKRENSLRTSLSKMLSKAGIPVTVPKDSLMDNEEYIHLDRSFANFHWWLCNSPRTVAGPFAAKYSEPIRDIILEINGLHINSDASVGAISSITKLVDFKKFILDAWITSRLIILKDKEKVELSNLMTLSHLYAWLTNLALRLQAEYEQNVMREKQELALKESLLLKQSNTLLAQKQKEDDKDIITSRSGRRVLLPTGWAAPKLDIDDEITVTKKKGTTSQRNSLPGSRRVSNDNIFQTISASTSMTQSDQKRIHSSSESDDDVSRTPKKRGSRITQIIDLSPFQSSPEVMPQKKNRVGQSLREKVIMRPLQTKPKQIATRSSKNKYQANDSNEDSDNSSSEDNIIVFSPRKTRSRLATADSKKVFVF